MAPTVEIDGGWSKKEKACCYDILEMEALECSDSCTVRMSQEVKKKR